MSTITITIANQKGGVGKTTTAVTLASGFAALGKRVLLIDTDVQGNVAHFLGLDPADELFQILMNDKPIAEVAIQAPDLHYLHVVRSSRKTAAIEATFSASADIMGWTKANLLADPLSQIDDYDLVFIDTAPALSSILCYRTLFEKPGFFTGASASNVTIVQSEAKSRNYEKFLGMVHRPPKWG